MNRLLVLALLALGLAPSVSPALEIKNIRPCWGPFGATRFERKCLPGDVFFMTYDIEGLELDPKTKKASYTTTLELLDLSEKDKEKVLFKNPTPNEVVPALGGARMPGDLHVIMGPKQKPGKYAIRLKIEDKVAKVAKTFSYDFEVVAEDFGFIHVGAQAIGFTGQHHIPNFKLVNMALDGKTKLPDAELTIRVLDENKKEVSEPAKMFLPKDIPEGTDLQVANVVALTYPIYLNRTGRFTIEVLAKDKKGNKTAELRYPLTVLDVSSFANK